MNKSVYTAALSDAQVKVLREVLMGTGFEFDVRPYMHYFAKKDSLSVSVYEKGPKVVVQGRGLEDFILFVLEPQVLGEAKFGYEEVLDPEQFEPHFGIDESGKGDFFGPLVVAGVYVDAKIAGQFREGGITDSKRISSDVRIRELAKFIRHSGAAQSLIVITPPKYNSLIAKIGNLNKLLAWGHARVIENLCEIRPDCPRALSDKFANVRVLKSALMERGRSIKLDQRTKAESDYAVAAASILARAAFIDWMDDASLKNAVRIPRGVSAATKKIARQIFLDRGVEGLKDLVKVHFKTYAEVLTPDFNKEHLNQ